MKPLPRVEAVPLFAAVQEELLALLGDLSVAEWEAPTRSTSWSVKDVVAHLLDGDVRRLSLHRDRLTLAEPDGGIEDYASLVAYLDALNAAWIEAARRMSPRLLVELTAFVTPRVVEHLRSLDPSGTARFAVAWAGETESENWFDIAREYTEKWHHQQQIREAVGRPLLTGPEWLRPLVSTLIRGVPPVYERYAADAGPTTLGLEVTGVVDGRWLLTNETGPWTLFASEDEEEVAAAETRVVMEDDTAWRLFTKTIDEGEAVARMEVSGDRALGELIARTVSYMK